MSWGLFLLMLRHGIASYLASSSSLTSSMNLSQCIPNASEMSRMCLMSIAICPFSSRWIVDRPRPAAFARSSWDHRLIVLWMRI